MVLEPKEGRTGPAAAGDGPRDLGEGAIEAPLIEDAFGFDRHPVGLAPPFPEQDRAGAGLSWPFARCAGRAREGTAARGRHPAIGLFLHLVGDRAHQQGPGGPGWWSGPVEIGPPPGEDVTGLSPEPGQRPPQLLGADPCGARHGARYLPGAAIRYTRPRASLAETIRSPSLFLKTPEMTPRTEWACQSVALIISATLAPVGSWSSARSLACLLPGRRSAKAALFGRAFRPSELRDGDRPGFGAVRFAVLAAAL